MRPLPGLVALLALAAQPAVAAPQEAADSAGIQATLRAFYFNLARRDWEAIAADVLSAKVLAHRPPPEILGRRGRGRAPPRQLRAAVADRLHPSVRP